MPLLKLHFPEEFVNPENFEDVLIQVNKNVPESGSKFKSRDEWMRTLLRNYAVASVNSLRRWETTRYVPTLTGAPLHVPDLTFWVGDIEGLDDGAQGQLIALHIGNLQYTYLGNAVVWENTYQREIVKSQIEYKNVAIFARNIILNALLQAQAQVDEEKLKEEEREILKEEQPAPS